MSLLDEVKSYLENTSGRQYKVWGPSPNRYLWRMLMLSAPNELLPLQQVCMRPDNSIEVGFDHFPDIGSTLCKLDESKYHIYMRPSEVMRSKDPDARKAAKKLAPGPIKDCEVAEKAAKKASSKYFSKEDVIRVDFDHMGMTVNFKAEGLTDEEVLKEIERSIKALSEAWTEFLKWYYSEERKRIYGKGGLKREPPYLRYFIAEWPPNTGNPEKDREIVKDVKQKLSRNDRVYTPKGLLELKNGEITVKKSRR